jgi:hypothetical protein
MAAGSILLQPGPAARNTKILQLYAHVELFSEGDPPANSLFIQGRAQTPNGGDHLLIVDPGVDAATRFRVDGQVAVIFTAEAVAVDLPLVHTVAGGVAHIRLGEHFVDIYSQKHGNVVVLPALGIVCSGRFGSAHTLPLLAAESDGTDELETCLLLARLLKQHHMQLFIPRSGGLIDDKALALDHLATDVSYLHSLRREIAPLAQRQEPIDRVQTQVEALLPRERATPGAETVHRANVARLYRTCSPLPS